MTRMSAALECHLESAPQILQHRYGVVVYGQRDHYQVALALHESGALERVFTDVYMPHWLIALADRVLPSLGQRLRLRHHPALRAPYFQGDLLEKQILFRYWGLRGMTLHQRHARLDRHLSQRGADYAIRHPGVGMLCYSYYWSCVAQARAAGLWSGPAVVFQVHPLASQIRRILAEDREETGLSYSPEAEEVQPPETGQEYVTSLRYADGVIAASSFTARGLLEAGVPASKVYVSPYGSGSDQGVTPRPAVEERWREQIPLRLLWVGQLAYRKAPHHLFDAVRRFPATRVEVSIVSRSTIPAELAALIPENARIYNSVSDDQRQEMYRTHHLLVLPSLAEGFGLVSVEALAEGLPILCTTNTGGADIIRDKVEGFIVPPGSAVGVADAIEACLSDPGVLPSMSEAARTLATRQTWSRFRMGIRTSIAAIESSMVG